MAVDDDRATAMYRHRAETLSVDRGSGPALVCSHSALMDRTLFQPQLEAFADEYRVVAYNSRARTDQWQGPYDLHDLAADCRALLETKGIDSCVLLGMSMGGFMTLRFALASPDLVDHWKRRWQTYPGEAVHDEVHSFIHAESVEDRLEEIDVPALVVHGEEDISIPPERAESMVEGIDDARMELIPNAGHCANLENPDAFNAALGEFLADVSG